MVAAKLANLKHGQKKADVEISTSQAEAADKLNINRATVSAAKKVLTEGSSELVRAVERGKVAVSAASALVTLPEQEQAVIALEPDEKRRRQLDLPEGLRLKLPAGGRF